MKNILEYFACVRKTKTRKWCIKKAIKVSKDGPELALTAQWIYDWIKK